MVPGTSHNFTVKLSQTGQHYVQPLAVRFVIVVNIITLLRSCLLVIRIPQLVLSHPLSPLPIILSPCTLT